MPEDAALLAEWKRQMDADKRAMTAEANVHQLNKVGLRGTVLERPL